MTPGLGNKNLAVFNPGKRGKPPVRQPQETVGLCQINLLKTLADGENASPLKRQKA